MSAGRPGAGRPAGWRDRGLRCGPPTRRSRSRRASQARGRSRDSSPRSSLHPGHRSGRSSSQPREASAPSPAAGSSWSRGKMCEISGEVGGATFSNPGGATHVAMPGADLRPAPVERQARSSARGTTSPDPPGPSTPDLLGSTLLPIPAASDEVSAGPGVALEPGWDARVPGSGLFGAPGEAVAPFQNPESGTARPPLSEDETDDNQNDDDHTHHVEQVVHCFSSWTHCWMKPPWRRRRERFRTRRATSVPAAARSPPASWLRLTTQGPRRAGTL